MAVFEGLMDFVDGLNRYGEKGWELVCSHATSEGSSYYLKREIKYEKEKDES